VFVYLAGHGAVLKGDYFFVAQDTQADTLPTTGLPLTKIKAAFDASPSQRAFLWLDFCHSGGILPAGRALEALLEVGQDLAGGPGGPAPRAVRPLAAGRVRLGRAQGEELRAGREPG
jgi:hypothetical protein